MLICLINLYYHWDYDFYKISINASTQYKHVKHDENSDFCQIIEISLELL